MLSHFHRFLCGFLALYLLNCSVDAPDAGSRWKAENLDYNEQESIVELVLEKALDMGDVIPEYDDIDCSDEGSPKKSFSVDHFVLPDFTPFQVTFTDSFLSPNTSRNDLIPQDFQSCFSPPPEA